MISLFKCLIFGHKNNMPKTNADRIRSMSDKELAEMMTKPGGGFGCLKCLETVEDECYTNCEEHCLKWLQQPAKEND